jgi:serine/threonine protein kinase
VSGRPPFRAKSAVAVLKRVAEHQPRAIREIIPETPQWLCDIIAKLHAKDPDDRYQSAREVADVLANCEAQLKANARLKDYSRIPWDKTQRSARRWLIAAVAALLLPFIALTTTELTGVTHLFHKQPALSPDASKSTAIAPIADADRRAAKYILSHGGWIQINGQQQLIQATGDLPRDQFELTTVGLYSNVLVTDAGLAVFEDCENLRAIFLYFDGQITDEGLAHLKNCKTLTHLALVGTKVSDAGLAYFKGKPLMMLWIDDTSITDLTPLQGMPLVYIRLTPKNITKGLDILRDMKSLGTIGIDQNQSWPAAEFWDRYDKGEFKE